MYKSKIFKFNGSYKYKFCYDFCQKKNIFFVLLNSQDFTLHLQKLRARLMQKNKIYFHRIPRMF